MTSLPSSTFFPTTLDVFYGQPFKLQIAEKKVSSHWIRLGKFFQTFSGVNTAPGNFVLITCIPNRN